MSERKPGWYHVVNRDLDEDWICAYWFECRYEGWMWAAFGEGFDDDQCDKIGDRIPTPDEPWQCVPVEPSSSMFEAYRELSIAPMGPLSLSGYRAMLAAAPSPDEVKP